MSKPSLAAAVALLAVTMAAAGIVAPPNEPPLADAGLDQDVSKGATVLLDGTGAHDPDGSIEAYRWTIRTPSDETVTPDCRTCARTSFEPAEIGQYRVTLTVTDEDGATSSDTLYVDVSPGSDPEISLSGDREPTEGDVETYTADLDPGTAALDYVVWTVGGTEIANHSLSPDQRADTAEKRFPTAGSRTLTATVYDADGQTGTSSLAVAVQSDSTQSPGQTPGTNPESPLADGSSPTVDGDAVVTGTEPLRGQYDVRLDTPTDDIEAIEWWNSAGRIGEGRSLTRTWEPGDHVLYAVVSYADGSENVATFDDGSTTVVADSKPNVSIDSLDRFGAISGTVTGLDEYENLETVRVEVDGETVATGGPNLDDYLRYDPGRRQQVDFAHSDFTPGEQHWVTVIAVDERGQTARTTTEIVPVKQPEIVRSEFVNGPVDSYHPRIDTSRYAAHHVLEIDLNGVDSSNITAVTKRGSEKVTEVNGVGSETYTTSGVDSDSISVHTFWKSNYPGEYIVIPTYNIEGINAGWKKEEKSTFEVTPSKPELRLDVVNDGTEGYITREHGILVNASDSFDPDGTELKYIWKYGATPTKPDNTTAKFWAYERAASIVEDEYDLQTQRDFDFLDYFVPTVEQREVLNSGPYYSDDTVKVRIETEAYQFSKRTYYDDFALGISVSNPEAEIVEWRQVEVSDTGRSGAEGDAYRYVGTVEIPASELSSSTQDPKITVYNQKNERKKTQLQFPDVAVLTPDGSYWSNLTLRDLKYSIEKPEVHEVTADSKAERDDYRLEGYSVDEKSETTEYVLEKRVKVQDAEYETEVERFSSSQMRDMFLSTQSEWYDSGSRQQEVNRTKTDTEWRDTHPETESKWSDSDLWNGEFSGETRQKMVDPAEYRTEKQYEYEYEVEKTATRTVTRTKTISVPRTGTRTTTHCVRHIGCYETTETYTYDETVTQTYTTTETYTYTVTRTDTYWATSKLNPNHERTGDTRRFKTEDAVYKTQYEIEQKDRYTESITVYEAARDKLVAPAEYDWEHAQTTEEGMLARRKANMDEDWRLSGWETDATWVLSKQTGTTRFEAENYENETHVVKTSATVTGDVVQTYVNERTGNTTTRVTERTEEFTYPGVKNRRELLVELRQSASEQRWCKVRGDCL